MLRCYLMCVVPPLYGGVFCTSVALVCLLLCKEEVSSPVSAITERRACILTFVTLHFLFSCI